MTFKYDNVYLEDASTIAGKLESEGPLNKYFDKCYNDYYMGCKSFEQGQIKMIRESINLLLDKCKLKEKDIDCLIGGDLMNQIAPTSYSMSKINIPFVGIYSACSTMVLSMIIASNFISNGINKCICNVSANNSATERQFRNPVEYGTIKPLTSTTTATGAVSVLLTNKKSKIKVESATLGKVCDYGVSDVYNMGAVMAPSASYVINEHLKDMDRNIDYYDIVLTGDLGIYGKSILKDLIKKEYNIKLKKYDDCGCLLYDLKKQNVNAGASGPTSSALVTFGYIMNEIKKGKYKRVLLVATGALHSSTLVNQKLSIPSISHAISLEAL